MSSGATDFTADHPKVLILLTSDISSVLVRGQLAHLLNEGFRVHAGTAVSFQSPASFDEGVTVHHLPLVREPSPMRDLRALVATIKLIRHLRPDIINVSTPKAALIGMAAAWLCRVPIRVYTVRGFRFETMSGRRRSIYAWLEKMIMSRAHQVIFNSASLRSTSESLSLIPPQRGLVLGGGSGNGIDLNRFAPSVLPDRNHVRALLNIPSDDFVIGFVGRLTADKGLDDLVTAFIALDHQATSSLDSSSLAGNCWLVVAGSLEDGDPLSQATHDILHSHPRIRLLGWVANPSEIYRGFDVLAFPSYREGLPNVPLEAQLCGVPVVGYAATGTVDAVRNGETGILVPVGDKSGLEHALRDVLSDEHLRRRLSTAAPLWVKHNFDQTKIWSELVTCYRQWLAAVR